MDDKLKLARDIERKLLQLFKFKRESKILKNNYLTLFSMFDNMHLFTKNLHIKNFKERLMEQTYNALNDINWKNIIISGTLLTKILQNTDIDSLILNKIILEIFIYDYPNVDCKIDELIKKIKINLPKIKIYHKKKYTKLLNQNIKIKVMKNMFISPTEILINQPIDILCIGYDGERLWITPTYHNALEKNRSSIRNKNFNSKKIKNIKNINHKIDNIDKYKVPKTKWEHYISNSNYDKLLPYINQNTRDNILEQCCKYDKIVMIEKLLSSSKLSNKAIKYLVLWEEIDILKNIVDKNYETVIEQCFINGMVRMAKILLKKDDINYKLMKIAAKREDINMLKVLFSLNIYNINHIYKNKPLLTICLERYKKTKNEELITYLLDNGAKFYLTYEEIVKNKKMILVNNYNENILQPIDVIFEDIDIFLTIKIINQKLHNFKRDGRTVSDILKNSTTALIQEIDNLECQHNNYKLRDISFYNSEISYNYDIKNLTEKREKLNKLNQMLVMLNSKTSYCDMRLKAEYPNYFIRENNKIYKITDTKICTKFYEAIWNNDESKIRDYLNTIYLKCISINSLRTPIHLCIDKKHVSILETLLDCLIHNKIDLKYLFEINDILTYCIKNGRIECLSQIVSKLKKYITKDYTLEIVKNNHINMFQILKFNRENFYDIIKICDENMLYYLLKYEKISTNILDLNRSTILHYLSKFNNNLKCIRLILELDITLLNMQNSKGETAIMLSHNDKIVRLLLEYGADITINDNKGRNLYHKIVKKNDNILPRIPHIIDLLNHQDNDGRNVIMMAIIKNSINSVKYLLKLDIEHNHQDIYGNTIYHYASIHNMVDIIDMKNIKNRLNLTPLDYYLQSDKIDKLLLFKKLNK